MWSFDFRTGFVMTSRYMSIALTGAILFMPSLVWAELNITALTANGTLTWTNTYTNANYRMESAATLSGPWLPMNNLSLIHGPDHQVSVQIPPPLTLPLSFYRVVWTDAPPAQPVGTWIYQGFDPSGALVVTGLVSITASNPVAGTCFFQALITNPPPAHPVGSGDFNNGLLSSPNLVNIPLPTAAFLQNNVQLSGQMVLDEYWGYWSYLEFFINLDGRAWTVPVSGRFSARRQN